MGNDSFPKAYPATRKIFSLEKYVCFSHKPEYKLLMVSLDATGKTTLLYNLVLGQVVSSIPTIGFNMEGVEFEKNRLMIWQVAGGFMIRQLWRHYVQQMAGIVYLIDLTDDYRLEEALYWLINLLSHQQTKHKYLFIIGNKKDRDHPPMLQKLETRIKQLNITQRYRIKYLSAFNREEVISTFREISEIFAIAK